MTLYRGSEKGTFDASSSVQWWRKIVVSSGETANVVSQPMYDNRELFYEEFALGA